MAITIRKTKYYGIDVVEEDGHYWVMDNRGNEIYFDSCPTEQEIEDLLEL